MADEYYQFKIGDEHIEIADFDGEIHLTTGTGERTLWGVDMTIEQWARFKQFIDETDKEVKATTKNTC